MKKSHFPTRAPIVMLIVGVIIILGVLFISRVLRSTNLIYKDTAGLFSLSYPADWKNSYPLQDGDGPLASHDWASTSRPFTFVPPHNSKGSSADLVQVLTADDANNWLVQSRADRFHTVQPLTVNGHQAYHDKLVFAGPANAERYTDDYYFVMDGGSVVVLSFRESYFHNAPSEQWDDVQDLPAFTAIVSSLKFLR